MNIINLSTKRAERNLLTHDRSTMSLRAELTRVYIACMMESTSDAYAAEITAIHAEVIDLAGKADAARIIAAIERLNGNNTAAVA